MRMTPVATGLDTATAIHYAEEKADRTPFVRWSKDSSGKTIPVRAGGCSEGFPKLDAVLAPYEKQAQVEKSLWRSYRIRDLVDAAEKAFRDNPLVTHCGDPDCARCNDAVKDGPKLSMPVCRFPPSASRSSSVRYWWRRWIPARPGFPWDRHFRILRLRQNLFRFLRRRNRRESDQHLRGLSALLKMALRANKTAQEHMTIRAYACADMSRML